MNIEKRFEKIQLFLREYSDLINCEPLSCYQEIPPRLMPWIENILRLKQEDKLELENDLQSQKIVDPAYSFFLKTVASLQNIPRLPLTLESIPHELNRKISQKKRHEISQIKSYLAPKSFNSIIDIGSGAGHLSTILLKDNDKKSLCIDQDSNFQEIGKRKLQRFAPEILERLTFKNITIDHKTKIDLGDDSLLVGLHACGDLSVKLLRVITQERKGVLLGLGCCYHKLSHEYLHLSLKAQDQQLKLNSFALNLAAKGYKTVSINELKKRESVKRYRYALHIFLKDHYNQEFTAVGNGLKSNYQGSFCDYFSDFAPEFYQKTSDLELNQFFNSTQTQSRLEILLALGIIRNQLSRLIELYIILDRSLFLTENGFEVELHEIFKREVSPRNLALYASLA